MSRSSATPACKWGAGAEMEESENARYAKCRARSASPSGQWEGSCTQWDD